MKQVSDILEQLKNREDIGVTLFERRITQNTFKSYKILHEDALLFSGHLKTLGVKVNEPVAIMLPNNYEFLVAFWGCVYYGAIPSAVYPPMKLGAMDRWEQRTRKLCDSIDARFIISQEIIYNLGHSGVSRLKLIKVKEALDSAIKGSIEKRSPENLIFIQFSSGTTGNPKPIAVNQKNVLENTKAILESFTLKDRPVHSCASWLPLYHDMGLVGAMICSFRKKGHLYLLRPEIFLANPSLWLEVIHHYKVNFTVAPNFAYGLCENKVKEDFLKEHDLSCLEVILSGAENVSAQTLHKFIEKFKLAHLNPDAIMPVYGMAETTLAATFSPHLEGPQFESFNKAELIEKGRAVKDPKGISLASLGSPLSGIEIKIINSKGEVLGENRLGEVCLKGGSVTPGIYHPEKKTLPHDLSNDFLKTGDQGFVHEGNLYLWGRIKDVLIINGKNFDAQYIEGALYELEFIRRGQIMAFSVQTDDAKEELVILCELQKNVEFKESFSGEVQHNIYKAINIKPDHIEFYAPGSLPKTSSGKLQRSEAKRLWLKDSISNYKDPSKLSILGKLMKGKWKSVLQS